ncbi:MAG TPA: DUF2760 domain-containing protein [Anaeromyxobacter sp.]
MREPPPPPLQRLVLAFYAFFAVLFRAEVASAVSRLREQRRLALPLHTSAPEPPAPASREAPAGTPTDGAAATARSDGNGAARDTPPSAPAPSPTAGAERAALRLLAALQREGRLVDFVQEDLTGFSDDQIGAAARTVHAGCKRAIEEHFRLEPVYPEPEGATVTVASGFDPAAVRLTGNVAGAPPFRGQLRHHGWKARDVKLPAAPDAADPSVVAPAEVEL